MNQNPGYAGPLNGYESFLIGNDFNDFLPWMIFSPLISVWSFLLDGIFVGTTRSAEMRNAMIVSLLLYLGAWYQLMPMFGNDGLWLALQLYFIARAATLLFYLGNVFAKTAVEQP